MEWISWQHLGCTCMIRLHDGQGWWAKVEYSNGYDFLLWQRQGVALGDEKTARAECESAAKAFSELQYT